MSFNKEFFEQVAAMPDRAQALRTTLIAGSLRSISVMMNIRTPDQPDLLQTILHKETADYLTEGERLLARLDRLNRQIDQDAKNLETPARIAAVSDLLHTLARRTSDMVQISPTRETIYIPYAALTAEERKDAIGDIRFALTQAFLQAAGADKGMAIEDVKIGIRPALSADVKKALKNGGLSPVDSTIRVFPASALPKP